MRPATPRRLASAAGDPRAVTSDVSKLCATLGLCPISMVFAVYPLQSQNTKVPSIGLSAWVAVALGVCRVFVLFHSAGRKRR